MASPLEVRLGASASSSPRGYLASRLLPLASLWRSPCTCSLPLSRSPSSGIHLPTFRRPPGPPVDITR
eukprot:1062763-Heterocapsa_arctica.AAC.1